MKRIAGGSVGVDQGSRLLFSDFADGGAMWTGHGPRESRHLVTFQSGFSAVPTVMVAISMWDLDQKTNLRADIAAENVTPTSFDLVFKTWGDTRIARIRADWTAIGALRDEDDWQLY
ncbi:MAG: H-type lectin domain-containing protein [Pseudorhodobacter sp.]|nr:H-type lectin domain-containing protein [Pseudorhodobacter sp.]